ncbi:hypothetical protein ACFPTO_02735 [Paraburkholderia denitrificans]|uniref:Uncharacterized protein n=1 Tax=Paraburkholderia denitrificans TaxID=694025 RepID=A0ABW0J401_9BURK
MSAIVVLNWRCYRAGALKTASPPGPWPLAWLRLACSACSTRGVCPAREKRLGSGAPARMSRRCPRNRRLTAEGKIAPSSLPAAFGGVREHEKAGWTNELTYPIGAEISRRNCLLMDEKGLCSKDLQQLALLIKPFLSISTPWQR